MPSSEGFVQAYNAQAAVDVETHLIVENHMRQNPNDKQEVEPTLKSPGGDGGRAWVHGRWGLGGRGLF